MKKILFATTNPGKVASLQHYFDHADIDMTVVATPLDITEIQADTALEVAEAKAHEAFRQLAQPLVVDDSELRIEALNGFPGPYQKAMTEKLGPEGFVKLMQGYDNRNAYFISNLVYVDETGAQFVFSDDPYRGRIAESVDTTEREKTWGPLWKIFIPEGESRTISQMSEQEKREYDLSRTGADAYQKFVEWYKLRDE